MNDRISKILATFFYLGYVPPASGSVASAAAAVICFLLRGHIAFYVVLFVALTAIGFVVSDRMEKMVKKKDPSCVVIDEVSGAMIAFFMLPATPAVIITAFFLFRAFDMFKIYPANKFECIPGGAGIMLDDIMAGIYTNIIMHIAIRFAGIS